MAIPFRILARTRSLFIIPISILRLYILRGGGGGGVQTYNFGNFDYEIRVEGKARTRPQFFRLVLGPFAQFYPFEASEQKWGQTPKSQPKEIEL